MSEKAVQANLRPSHSEKILKAMKAESIVNLISFNPRNAEPGQTLNVSVPTLADKHEVIVPGSFYLVFNIDLSGGHANNFLVKNVSRALVDKLVVKFAGTAVQDIVG